MEIFWSVWDHVAAYVGLFKFVVLIIAIVVAIQQTLQKRKERKRGWREWKDRDVYKRDEE